MKKIVFTFYLILFSNAFSQENIWEPTSGNFSVAIFSIAVAPNDIVYVGTYNGFYKSTNNGDDWIDISSELGGYDVHSIVFNNSGDIFVGTNPGPGVFKSTDEGLTWTHLNDSLVSFSISGLDINSNGYLFASIHSHGVYRSTDDGNSWDEMNNGLDYLSMQKLYVAKAGQIKDYIFVSVCELLDYSYIFRSTDNGESWQQMNYSDSWLWTYSFISSSDGLIFIGTWNIAPHSVYGAIFKSVDYGVNWISGGSNANTTSLVIDRNEYIYAGTEGGWMGGCQGIIRTTDGGNTWESFNSGLLEGSCGAVLACNSDGILFAGTGTKVYRTIQSTTDVANNDNNLPKQFTLSQNYPNPFNPSTKIRYQLPQSEKVTLKVYDIIGKEIAELVNEVKPAGKYEITFDAPQITTGVYFYSLQAGDFFETKKMILIK
jgi:photosystem II stability/assembly factor-like uncharacterized protein